MTKALAHRGRTTRGSGGRSSAASGWGWGTRLSILDLSPAVISPCRAEDGRLWIVFNGEIFNYQD